MEIIRFIDGSGKARDGINIKCPICDILFITRVSSPNKTCSKKCSDKLRTKKIELKCAWCDSVFLRKVDKLKYSKSGLYFCTRKCKDEAQKLGGIKEIQPSHFGTGPVDYRAFFSKNELFCRRCGYKEFIPSVQIHHIDKNHDNNKKENLIPLCANCHWALHFNFWNLIDIYTYEI